MPPKLIRNDMTKMQVDAIVNAARKLTYRWRRCRWCDCVRVATRGSGGYAKEGGLCLIAQ